jgi:hypothetical protein
MPASQPLGVDDPSIPDDELLYIRIYPAPHLIQRASTANEYRPASGALKDEEGPLSVDLASKSTLEQTRDRDTSHPFHVAAFTAGTARKYGCRVVRDPTVENPAHAHVYGNHQRANGALIYKSQSRKIAHEARIVLLNPNAPPPIEVSGGIEPR